MTDAGARVRALEEALARRDALLLAARRDAVAFAAGVSHELRQPLQGIDAAARVLADARGGRLDADGQRLLARIASQVARLKLLAAGIDALGRLERSEQQDVDLDMEALARAALERARAREPDRRVDGRVLALPRVHGDPSMLREAFAHLLDNALKFTRPREVAEIEIGGERRGGEVVYHVRDNGVGFDPRFAGRLFEPFHRLHGGATFEGAGVGLAVVRRIAHRHGGRAWARGAVDAGATFWLALPSPGPGDALPTESEESP